MCACFVSADWSKHPKKRSVYVANIENRSIWKDSTTEFWNFKALLDLANNLRENGPVLIGVDVVLGVSKGYWEMVLEKSGRHQPKNFVHWLRNLDPNSDFFNTNDDPSKWHVDRPWFTVPRGKGGLKSFTEKVSDGLRRRIDRETVAKPVFAVSGIPGVVGAGTRCFWKELIPTLTCDREFTIWPFEINPSNLLQHDGIVLCETYPGIAYATALVDKLPTCKLIVSKTKQEGREKVCELLAKAKWVERNHIDLGAPDALIKNEDDFDAHITAAAVMRCVVERKHLISQDWIDVIAEGSMLLVGAVDPTLKGRFLTTRSQNYRSSRTSSTHDADTRINGPSTKSSWNIYNCPISGCSKSFYGSRSGWDAHVASYRMHPDWHPDIKNGVERKRLFRKEFQEWFNRKLILHQ